MENGIKATLDLDNCLCVSSLPNTPFIEGVGMFVLIRMPTYLSWEGCKDPRHCARLGHIILVRDGRNIR